MENTSNAKYFFSRKESLSEINYRISPIITSNIKEFGENFYQLHQNIVEKITHRHRCYSGNDFKEYYNLVITVYTLIINILCGGKYFLFDSNLKKFIYNRFSFDDNKKFLIKPIIANIVYSSSDIPISLKNLCIKLILKILYEIVNDDNFFQEKDESIDKSRYDLRKLSSVEKWHRKCTILDFLKHTNYTQKKIAEILGVDPKTVRRIQNMLKENHFLNYVDLYEKQHGPAKNHYKKIPKELWYIVEIAMKSPTYKFDLNYSCWSAKAIAQFLLKKHNFQIDIKYLYYYLKKRNYTSKVGQRCNPKQDPAEVGVFLNGGYEQCVREAKENGEEIIFLDEMSVKKDCGARSYAVKGERAFASHNQQAGHTNYSLLTIMNINGGFQIKLIEGPVDTGWVIYCLKKWAKDNPNKKYLLFMDSAGIHTSEEFQSWLQRKNGGKKYFRVIRLPRYSPKLNPVEFFNNDFHTRLRDMNLHSANEVVEEARNYIAWYLDNRIESEEKIRKFFYAEECRYTVDIYKQVFGI